MLPLIKVLTWDFLPVLDGIRKLYFRAFETSLAEAARMEYKDAI